MAKNSKNQIPKKERPSWSLVLGAWFLSWSLVLGISRGCIVPRLIVIKGADEGKQVDLTEPVLTVGRDSTNLIRLHDTEVSRRHAEFRQEGNEYKLVDVGSA